jgi:hypothetical protein
VDDQDKIVKHYCQKYICDFFICEFKQRMKDNFISEMNTFFNESPKCLVYRYIFDNNVLQFYLDRPLNFIYYH